MDLNGAKLGANILSTTIPSLFPGGYPITNNVLRGTGQLTWLSSKGGLITIKNPPMSQKQEVSFQLKDFVDSQVTDLTTVLRVGFYLYFQATPSFDNQTWIATQISPVTDNEQFMEQNELDLEYFEKNCEKPNNFVPKDPYVLDIEKQAVMFMLSLFQKNAQTHMPLPSVHSKISNSGNEEMYSYIGSSSLKRRSFLDKRSYVMGVTESEIVYLQHPDTYTTVCLLTKYLLTHGGVTPLDKLFNFFCTNSSISIMLKENVKNPPAFIEFLARHDFVFSIFPSRHFVSVRHNLPYFDYPAYIQKYFPHTQLPVFINSTQVIYLNTTGPTIMRNASNIMPYNGFDVLANNSKNNLTNGSFINNKSLFHDDPLKRHPMNGAIGGRSNNLNNNGSGINCHNNIWPNDVGYFENQQPIFGQQHNNNNNNNMAMTPIIGATPITGQNSSSMDIINRHSSEINLMNSNSVGIINGANLPLTTTNPHHHQHQNSLLMDMNKLNGLMNGIQINSTTIKQTTTSTQTEGPLLRTFGCVCKCTCGNLNQLIFNQQQQQQQQKQQQQQQHQFQRKSPTNGSLINNMNLLMGSGLTAVDFYNQSNKKLEDNIIQIQNQFSDNLRQRSIIVKDQPIFGGTSSTIVTSTAPTPIQIQRPLFSSLTASTNTTTNKLPSTNDHQHFFSSYMTNTAAPTTNHGQNANKPTSASSKNTSPNSIENLKISPIFENEKAYFESRLNLPVNNCTTTTTTNNNANNTINFDNNPTYISNPLSTSTSSIITSSLSDIGTLTVSPTTTTTTTPTTTTSQDGQNCENKQQQEQQQERLYDLFPPYIHPFNSSSLANFL